MATPDRREPRAAWWAFKAYAESVSSRVRSESTDPRIVVFGSRAERNGASAQIIIGYYARGESPATINLTLRMENVRKIAEVGRSPNVDVKIQ